MTTRIATNSQTSVQVAASATRTTAAPARPFHAAMQATSATLIAGADATISRLPGGPILAAAVRAPIAPAAGTSTGGAASPVGGSTAGGSDPNVGTAANGLEATLAENADKTLYYLNMQQRIAAESESFTALSNVLKARHETSKNAISNIR